MKMKGGEKRILGFVFIVAYLSGVTLYLLNGFVRVQTTVGEQHHSSEHLVRFIHAALTYAVVLCLGFVLKSHVLPGLKARSNKGKKSGLILLICFGTMVVTALGILYLGETEWRSWVSFTHSYLGLSLSIFLFIHLLKNKIINALKLISKSLPILAILYTIKI